MSQSKVGVDLAGEVARIVCVQAKDVGEIITLRTAPISEWRNAIGADKSRVTIAVDDRLSNVRIVRPAIIDPALAGDAAEYEARIAMLGQDPDLRIDVTHIGNSSDPRAWLAVSTHTQAAIASCVAIAGQMDASTLYLPRSVACGRGYLFGCDTQAVGASILIDAGQVASPICFLNGRAVVGTAQLKGVSPEASDTELAAWFSELRMIVQYRLSTDLCIAADSGGENYIWAGDSGLSSRVCAISGLTIRTVKLRPIAISPESDAPALTTDWLAALGAALN